MNRIKFARWTSDLLCHIQMEIGELISEYKVLYTIRANCVVTL